MHTYIVTGVKSEQFGISNNFFSNNTSKQKTLFAQKYDNI